MHRWRVLASFAAVTFALGACGDAIAPTVLDGTYQLVRLNGRILPFDFGPLPPRPGTTEDCHLLLTAGMVSVVRAQGTYELTYEKRNSCDNRLLSSSGSFGSYRQNGAQLVLTADLGGGRTEDYEGRVSGSVINVSDSFYDYTFQR
jgi:hypothetical protein